MSVYIPFRVYMVKRRGYLPSKQFQNVYETELEFLVVWGRYPHVIIELRDRFRDKESFRRKIPIS